MAKAFSVHTLAKALELVLTESESQYWVMRRPSDHLFLNDLAEPAIRDISRLEELKAKVGLDADTVNKFLEENGYSIRLRPWTPADNMFGVAAVQDTVCRWLEPGDLESKNGREITLAGKTGFRLRSHKHGVSFFDVGEREPAVCIETKGRDGVIILRTDDAPLNEFELASRANLILSQVQKSNQWGRDYDGVDLPMVYFDVQPDISWLVGLKTDRGAEIMQAVQQVTFGMNQFGARAKQASALGATRGISIENYYKVDGPFLVIFGRVGCKLPTFHAYVEESDFRDPGDFVKPE